MSISLPNGTLLATPATQTQYTAAVTRILHLANFSPELKTRDLQAMFKDFESEKGGFRIKWLDDVNALVVFAEASAAKRAYLSFLLLPPPQFAPGQIKPYDKPDAAQIIQALSARAMGHRSSMSNANTHAPSGSVSVPLSNGGGIEGLPNSAHHGRAMSSSAGSGASGGAMGSFSFPKSSRSSISGPNGTSNMAGNNRNHNRTGSSSSFSRQPLSGVGVGVLNFGPSSAAGRLPTHTESLDSPALPTARYPARRTTGESSRELGRTSSGGAASRSASSSDTEPLVVMDHAPTPTNGLGFENGNGNGNGSRGGFGQWKMPGTGGSSGMTARRDSVSAEKAMREVEKALAGVEAQG